MPVMRNVCTCKRRIHACKTARESRRDFKMEKENIQRVSGCPETVSRHPENSFPTEKSRQDFSPSLPDRVEILYMPYRIGLLMQGI